jgi:hypothetical protein
VSVVVLTHRPELRLGREAGTEALERDDQRLDLVERVLALLGRVDRELEVDLVDAVGDPQLQPRRRQAAPLAVRGVGEAAVVVVRPGNCSAS